MRAAPTQRVVRWGDKRDCRSEAPCSSYRTMSAPGGQLRSNAVNNAFFNSIDPHRISIALANELPVREGEIIAGKYRVEKMLGRGGMGVVVAATNVDLDQRVAIKFVLPPAAASDDLLERFMREARAVARLKSEHVT